MWGEPHTRTNTHTHTHTHTHTRAHAPTHRNIIAIKKNEIMPFVVTRIDLGIIILNEVSQRKTNIIYLLYM